eukprot:TRINITY_DN40782_c0_g1_i1.p1 TRINITY_DN40782_c0_g1~~TRINITY_DN40782_c0_g1_i1.p1  ORF type:complete len:260 (-),score=33.47 TRINITY_DN40782_c0_g1_i1:199-978(-)
MAHVLQQQALTGSAREVLLAQGAVAPAASDGASSGLPVTVGAAMPVATDTYFADEFGLVATFDFDYDEIIDFNKKFAWTALCFFPPAWSSCLCCVPCFLNQNIEWRARAQHVALTIDGIRYVQEKRKSLCGLPCSDLGKESKTVPFDKITDCDVTEPAGTACCCCVQNTLSVVNIDTASSGASKEGLPRHELSLRGLKYPNEFKRAVWGMKRGQAPSGAAIPLDMINRNARAPQQIEMEVLVEIRDELREMNQHLRSKV